MNFTTLTPSHLVERATAAVIRVDGEGGIFGALCLCFFARKFCVPDVPLMIYQDDRFGLSRYEGQGEHDKGDLKPDHGPFLVQSTPF
jgi:hypothetical protein